MTMDHQLRLIKEPLELVCRTIDEQLESRSKICNELLKHFKSKPGKMIRPSLLLLSAGACGEINKSHILSAAILQMIHDATLLHDDVIDHGLIRRNIPTINSLWGNKGAILLGDIVLSHAFKLSSSMGQKIIDVLTETTLKTCEGEITQDLDTNNDLINEDEYLQIVKLKSATMFGSCCYLGAFLCNEKEEICRSLERFGISTGIAYQISDDIADICNNETQLSKSSDRDIYTRIKTLPFIHLSQQGYDYNKVITLNKREIIRLLKETGSISYCLGCINRCCSQANEQLSSLRDSEYKTALAAISESVFSKAFSIDLNNNHVLMSAHRD